ncbi:unnamed protein product [Heligmosomoides polygyrus]|uniref:Uncharacterized protein n=1 Tax=Heligmosomoides polygyrus TaxID=6339 RepID=A0A3P7XE94_HELPZ|nr:unnamed protein product [Heligmosomoides polygyrus]
MEGHVARLVLPFLTRRAVSKEALRTLEKYVSERSRGIMLVGDEVSQVCYSFFMDESNGQALRLEALKCIGYVLSMRRSNDVMAILNNVMAPHLKDLEDDDSGFSDEAQEERKFQINIFACLFASLNYKGEGSVDRSRDSPCVIIFQQVFPVFLRIIEKPDTPTALTDKVCDAVRCAISNLPPESLSEALPLVSQLLSTAMFTNPAPACALAKSAVLANVAV